jgi:hypothetical protein
LGTEDVGAPQQKPRSDIRHIRTQAATSRAMAFALVLVLVYGTAARSAEADVNEFTIKAAYLAKFGGFIRWPDGAFSSDASPLTICMIGETPVGGALTKAVSRPVGNRPLMVRTIKVFSPNSGCHILYIGDSNPERVAQTLKAAHGAGVLTVTDLTDNTVATPVINFVMKENHVRFEIDERAASENGLAISSQLLGLAVSVKSRG